MLTLRATAYEFGPYRLDPLGRSLLRDGEVVALPPKAVEVLMALVRNPGAVVGKPELIDAVWPESFVEEANLNQMIFLLRRAFGGNGGGDYIATIPRRGYRFTAGVRTVEIPCRIESIAVLPLANLSGDPSQEYFADGVTEALITELAKIRSLRVVSRTSVMRYRGTKESIAQIARALRAQALLEGSVIKSGDRFRITAQLLHAGADQHLWAETYEGATSDILDVQARMARDVAAGLRAELSQDERSQLTTLRTVHPQAYSLYLKGRYNARILTEEGQRKAIRYFQDSVSSDPHDATAYYYASAYAGIAECYIELAYFFGMEPKRAFVEAEAAAVKAVALDAKLAEAHAALGLLRLLNDWDWSAADIESRRAIELAPDDAYVYWRRGVCLRYAGRSEEAVAAHRHAEFLDPFSVVAIQEVGWALYYGRRFDEAVEQFHKAVELEPGWDQLYFGLGQTLVQLERHEEAIAALSTAARMGPGNAFTEAALAYALGRAGRIGESERALERLTEKYAYVPYWFYSIVSIGLNDKRRALEALENAFRDHEPCLVSLKVDPVFDPLRQESRFSEMIRRVGLEP
ncbi:MAG: winged helix-turn-helix domain-containing tetratricopeptide repeat protein [Steroidobacteraceae bacterium]